VSSLTAMERHRLTCPLRFIALVALLVAGLAHVADAEVSCYACTDDPNDTNYFHDANCSTYDYGGFVLHNMFEDYCNIHINDNGYIERHVSINAHEDGGCLYYADHTTCVCKGNYCNTHSYCEHCFPTTATTEPTTTSTPPPPATTKPPTTDASTETTSEHTLRCFNCIGCSNVEEGDTAVIEDEFLACMTAVVLDSGVVIRGGSYEEHPDGECVGNTGTIECWCNQDLCNKDPLYY
ncbi:unnamed protein product, partial [Meganyctiphanes norvegica]